MARTLTYRGMVTPLLRGLWSYRPRLCWARFSLRTLFVIVSLLCVLLSALVVPVEKQRRAVAAIMSQGGWVMYAERPHDTQTYSRTPFLRRWLPRDYFDEVREVELGPSESRLAHLRSLPRVRTLILRGTRITDAELTCLTGMTVLRKLHLDDTQITDAGLAQLREMKCLREIYLGNTQITDAGLAHLHGLWGLDKLHLRGTRVTETGVARLELRLPDCRIYRP